MIITSPTNLYGNASELARHVSLQAHKVSDAQDKQTKHCDQGLYFAETS